jgi:DnaJ-domain-containing protein 1
MNARIRLSHAAILALAAVFGLVCASVQSAQAGERKQSANSSSEVASLRQAYALLESADHDYQGHRARAMHSIEAACKILGSEVRGDGKADEQQGESDSQLKQAKSLLESVQGAGAGKNERALHHIKHAIEELDVALSVK